MQISLVFNIGHEPWIVCHLTKRWFLQQTKVRQTMWKRQKFRIVRLRPCCVQVGQIFDKVGFLQRALVRQVLNVIRIGQALDKFQFDFKPQGFLCGGFGGGWRCSEGGLAHGCRGPFSFWHGQCCCGSVVLFEFDAAVVLHCRGTIVEGSWVMEATSSISTCRCS